MDFDPNARAGAESGIFGLPYSEEEAHLIFLPVPWDATTSYLSGAHKGPSALLSASHQLDLFDYEVEKPYQAGMHMLPLKHELISLNHRARAQVEKILAGGLDEVSEVAIQKDVNALSEELNGWVYQESRRLLAAGKLVALIGGDHSTPFGLIRALGEIHDDFGVLHFDAHSDTRRSYMGFQHSHASIMHNVLERIPSMKKLVQVGIRDFGEDEYNYTLEQGARVKIFFDQELQNRRLEGTAWAQTVKEIVAHLPAKVYVSFDIDGLNPALCPSTGTPVPGGLDFHQATYLVREVARSGRTLIGLDVVEVAPHPEQLNEWDANVGMRLVYKLSAYALASQNKRSWR